MAINFTRLLQFSQQFCKFYAYRFEELLEESGLTMREIHVLLFLANHPDYDTARDICMFRGLSKSQVSQAVDLLAADGLLSRTPDTADRRVIHLSITENGLPWAQRAQEIQSSCGEALIEGLSEEEVGLLQATLETILDNGEQLAEEVAR